MRKLLAFLTLACLAFACHQSAPAAVSVEASTVAAPPRQTVDKKVPDLDSCTLLAPAELAATFGGLKDAPLSARGLRDEHECRVTNMDGQWLELSLYSAERWELEKGIVSEQHPTPLAGLGDEAFSVKQGSSSVVFVRTGGAILETSCSCGLEKTKRLAASAVASMGARS